jgi:uncharacterized protein
MLLQLTIENFLSFRDSVTFSMVGVNEDQQHADRLLAYGKGKTVLPIAAIYGANAAGKSNLIEAVSFAKDLIVEGTRGSSSIPVSTFKLGDYRAKASKFEFIFTYQGAEYSYGFQLNREQILEEWLYGIPAGKKRDILYFERSTSAEKKTSVNFGAPLVGKMDRRKQFLEFIVEGTRPNQLFLTEAIDRNVQELMPVTSWFKDVLVIIPAEADYIGLEIDILEDYSFTDFLSKFLTIAGTGIDRVFANEEELDLNRHFPNTQKNEFQDFLEKLPNDENGKGILLLKHGGLCIYRDDSGIIKLIRLMTQHRNEKGDLIDFHMSEESEGTQRLMNLIPIFSVLQDSSERIVFLDELDRRLHPLLSRLFVETVIKCDKKENQLIFTTHDTNLLDLELLRRDEVWFVEKDRQGASGLYSLAEFKARSDLKIEKGYLNGRFGAIPFFGDPDSLGWFKSSHNPEKQPITSVGNGQD